MDFSITFIDHDLLFNDAILFSRGDATLQVNGFKTMFSAKLASMIAQWNVE